MNDAACVWPQVAVKQEPPGVLTTSDPIPEGSEPKFVPQICDDSLNSLFECLSFSSESDFIFGPNETDKVLKFSS